MSDQTINIQRSQKKTKRSSTASLLLASLEFCHPWRAYQARVLDAIDSHLGDRKLHIVAAPGAGKTSLGLEVIRRLGNSTLILSPTRIVRNQWLERLEDFLPENTSAIPDWCSTDLHEPHVITSVTYQALHSLYREAEEESTGDTSTDANEAPPTRQIDQLASILQSNQVKTLVLDEAHHLQSAWWKALTHLTEQLPDLHIISLTATPPYDAVGHNWARYQALCGPIDEEISVPELVKAGTLCPHQDFCYMTALGDETLEQLRGYDRAVADTILSLETDREFFQAVLSHPWLHTQEVDIVELLDDTEFAFGLLSYLKHNNASIPKKLLRPLDARTADLPVMNRRWWGIVIRRVLFSGDFDETDNIEALRKRLKKMLRAKQLLKGRQLQFDVSISLRQKLRHTPEKITACVNIYKLEQQCRGEQLRQVILTDFIRDETIGDIDTPPDQLGAWPVFRALLLNTSLEEARGFAMLTGRYGILHRQQWLNGDETAITVRGAAFNHDYLILEGSSHQLTRYFTERLITGDLHVLIGTRALLGEGWDCPVVNSLVLASYVGAFVSTNQMRGRALRVDKNQPEKVASIWHLVAIHEDTDSGLWDYISLYERFRTFVGLHNDNDNIESGVERLQLPAIDPTTHRFAQKLAIKVNNRRMANQLSRLPSIKTRWTRATTAVDNYRVIPSIRVKQPTSLRVVHFSNTLSWLLFEAGLAFAAGYSYVVEPFQYVRINDGDFTGQLLMIAFGAGALWALPKLGKALYGLVKHLPVDGSIKQIAGALKSALCETNLIKTEEQKLKVVSNNVAGKWTISLQGGDFYESSLFADCLNELLGPVENPRYLITRKSAWRTDYHPLPTVLATHKAKAECFFQHWRKRVCNGELIYTRREDGRSILLKARSRNFAGIFVPKHERLDQWQ